MEIYRKFVVIACLGMMFGVAGCASNDVVKKDESLGGKEATAKTLVKSDSTKTATTVKKSDDSRNSIVPASTGTDKNATKGSAIKAELEKIYFNFDSADLSKEARETLSRNANYLLKERKVAKLRIEGNCDERGSAEYNLALGERRADAAAAYLKTLGVQPERISIVSFGKERPAVQGDDETAWSKNRRDEFVILK